MKAAWLAALASYERALDALAPDDEIAEALARFLAVDAAP